MSQTTEAGFSIQTKGVVGAGTMGNGIAQVAARAGFKVILRDVKDEFLQRGMAAGRNHTRTKSSFGIIKWTRTVDRLLVLSSPACENNRARHRQRRHTRSNRVRNSGQSRDLRGPGTRVPAEKHHSLHHLRKNVAHLQGTKKWK